MSLASGVLHLPLFWPPPSVVAVVVCVVSLMSLPVHLIDPRTTLECHVRSYQLQVSKAPVVNQETGEELTCSGRIEVNSCWGRCDSSEVGTYQMPYKISNHPVCSYTGRIPRRVTLTNCGDYPDPTFDVFDAAGCECRVCNTDTTNCENLNE